MTSPRPRTALRHPKAPMTPCTVRSALARTGALALVFGTSFSLTLGSTGVAVAQDPAADAAPSTVQAAVAADGAVTDVKRLGGSGETPSAEDLPVKVDISDTPADGARTLAYHVENTTVKSEDVSYTAPDGTTSSVKQDVALPLVAQLSVRLPATMTEVTALGARVTQLADGSTEVVWSLVLFGPVGSPIQDVTLSAKGEGTPVARLATQAVQPNSTPGLSTTAQAANATINGNGILDTVRNGADEGLGKLAAGVGQLVDGLEKLDAGSNELATGLKAAGDGSNQLADGSEAAKYGSSKLAAGLDQISDGATALSTGAKQLDAGTGTLSAGLDAALVGGKKIAVGGGQLATGAKEASTGATALAAGLAEISAGLGQLSAAQGLPAALDGAKRLRVGVEQLRAGLGAPETEGTILNGLAKTGGGLAQVKAGLDALGSPTAGLPAAKGGVDQSKGGVDQVRAGLSDALKPGGSVDQLSGGVKGSKQLVDGARQQLACTPGSATPTASLVSACDKLENASAILGQLQAGVDDPNAGLRAKTGAAAAGLGQVSGGLAAVSAGLVTANAGVAQLGQGVA
ncbi:MAG: hypothetical protein JWO60_3404, partial [Frankiales bacterium]|nr:hypothetical protein [Frankiales bacterium]